MNRAFDRPTPRQIFLTKEKQLQTFFYTSNLAKYLHARVVFDRSGLILHHFRSKQDPYSEDYSKGKTALLARAIQEILSTVGSGSVFFVEDTSLRIDALSNASEDIPGLAVKEWFQETSFALLDEELKKRGNNRRAQIQSDIALHLPGLVEPVYFHGRTDGVVADSPPDFEENPHYPWLTPASFNGWFVPEGGIKRLGEMSLEESWAYDFRTRALEQLISRLEQYTAILNLSPQAHTSRPTADVNDQFTLFSPPVAGNVLIVVGHTCAGKTTFGEHAHVSHQLAFIEASSVLRMIEREHTVVEADDFTAAKRTLETYGPDVVARKILTLYMNQLELGAVITGFRTIEEVEVIRKEFPSAKLILIEASDRTRFQRLLERVRTPGVRTLDGFKRVDEQQWSFGLLRAAEDFANVKIVNEGTLNEYHQKIDAVISGETNGLSAVSTNLRPRHGVEENQMFRCLLALGDAARPLSCDEIEEITGRSGRKILHNNANKVLKRVPELAKRLEVEGIRVRYEITNAGRAYVRIMRQLTDQ